MANPTAIRAKSELRRIMEPKQGVVALVSAASAINTPTRGVLIQATVAGNLTLTFADGSTLLLAVVVGAVQYDWAIVGFTNGTATATVTGLL